MQRTFFASMRVFTWFTWFADELELGGGDGGRCCTLEGLAQGQAGRGLSELEQHLQEADAQNRYQGDCLAE